MTHLNPNRIGGGRIPPPSCFFDFKKNWREIEASNFLTFPHFIYQTLWRKKILGIPFGLGCVGYHFWPNFQKWPKMSDIKKSIFFSNEVSKPTKSTPGNPFLRLFFRKNHFLVHLGPLLVKILKIQIFSKIHVGYQFQLK